MSFDWRLLEILTDGEFHSGEELGEELGISRAAVWKQLQKIESVLSLRFESIKGRGYRLPDGLELLSREQIVEKIPPGYSRLLYIERQIDSTNRFALDLARAGAGRGCVVLAEQQLAGRGRRGRAWVSPFARNIYCSIVWEFDSGAAALEGLSLAVGVGVVRALSMSGVRGVALKWPNDVLYDQRKLAGILIEMSGDVSGRCQVVVGVGVNVSMASSPDVERIDQPWVDASTVAGRAVSRNELAANLVVQLLRVLEQFERDGFRGFQGDWAALDCFYGRSVSVHLGDGAIHGVAAGVDDSGALIIDTDVGRQWFYGGEVSLRALV